MSSVGLIDFWSELFQESSDFLHPQDKGLLSARQLHDDIRSYEDYVLAFENDRLRPKAFHPHLMPQPYLGDLENADIVVLLINPGLHPLDYVLEERYPEFRDQLAASTLQEHRSHIFLNPKWAWTTGFAWWYSKLRTVVETVAKEKFAGNTGRALKYVAARLCSIELVPYHSIAFDGTASLPSSTAARNFVGSLGDERTVILTRGVKYWDLPERDKIVRYEKRYSRSASLSAKSKGGKVILKSFGIEV